MMEWWYRFKHKAVPFILAHLGKGVLKLLLFTCRIEIKGAEKYLEIARERGCILMLWHNRIILATEIFLRCAPNFIYAAFASKSRHGEIISVVTNSYKRGKVIRVAHNGKTQALKAMINHLRGGKEMLVIAPDGPRGPRYQVKPGVVLAAKATATPVVPLTWHADKVWEFKTWDRLKLPKPFSRITVDFGDPLIIERDSGRSVEEETERLQAALATLGK